jgi:hypothetical protein
MRHTTHNHTQTRPRARSGPRRAYVCVRAMITPLCMYVCMYVCVCVCVCMSLSLSLCVYEGEVGPWLKRAPQGIVLSKVGEAAGPLKLEGGVRPARPLRRCLSRHRTLYPMKPRVQGRTEGVLYSAHVERDRE